MSQARFWLEEVRDKTAKFVFEHNDTKTTLAFHVWAGPVTTDPGGFSASLEIDPTDEFPTVEEALADLARILKRAVEALEKAKPAGPTLPTLGKGSW